jgi:hypothetical protein
MKPRKTRKPRSPRVVKHRTRHPRVVKETVAPVRQVAPVYYGMQPSFPKRHDPFSQEELAGLEIPAFLKRELPAHVG